MSNLQPDPVETMGDFFNARADGYDRHMCDNIYTDGIFEPLYGAICLPIPATDAPLRILDLGCGTGLEIEFLLRRAPNAQIVGVDVAAGMLDLLRQRYEAHMDQITLLNASFLDMPLEPQSYDYIVSAMAMHHFFPAPKLALYKKIRRAIKPGGKYIEGDSVVLPETAAEELAYYHASVDGLTGVQDGQFHLDLPFTLEEQKEILAEAGFRDFELLWQRDPDMAWNIAVYAVGP